MPSLRKIISILYPERCPYCSDLVEPDEIACRDCMSKIVSRHEPITIGVKGYRCVSSFIYDGKVRRMIVRVKFQQKTQHIRQVAQILAEDIRKTYDKCAFDIITAVPMHKKDLLERGYNQSEILAKEIGRILCIPYLDTLIKVKHTKKQHHIPFRERTTNLRTAFHIIGQSEVKGQSILIIDDVVTSGNTLGACCKELSKGNPGLICCATIARANLKVSEKGII